MLVWVCGAMAGSGKREQDAGDGGVDLLVVLDLAVAEVEERLPADVSSRGWVAAEQVGAVVGHRVAEGWFVGVEDEREERVGGGAGAVAGAAGEVGAVGRADHAVPEPVGGGAELDRHERLPVPRTVEAIAAPQHLVDHGLTGDLRQVLVDQQPLVMPQRELARDQEPHVAVVPVGVAGGGKAPQVVLA